MRGRWTLVVLCLLTAVVSASPVGTAAARAAGLASPTPLEHFVAQAVAPRGGMSEEGTRDAPGFAPVEFGIERWSTDAEREEVIKALVAGGPEEAARVLGTLPVVGYLRYLRSGIAPPEAMRQNIRYACDTKGANGERRIILAIDFPALQVIDLRFAASGVGQARVAGGGSIAIGSGRTTIELKDDSAVQMFLRDVRRR